VLSPVDKELMLLVWLDKPAEVEVDSDDTLLFVVLSPLDSEVTPVEMEPATVDNCETLTASVCAVPAATPVMVRLPTLTSPLDVCVAVKPYAE
jgi:hypothetical protein